MTRAAAAPLDLHRLNRATLARQGLIDRYTGPVEAVVGRLAGLQAQHADMPYVALWSRMAGGVREELERALTERRVVKATVMRSTLHLVAATDYPAFDRAVAAARMAVWTSTARKAGLDLVELHQALLAFCHEPRTVQEMEAHLDAIAPDERLAGAVPDGVRHGAFRLASAGGGLVHVPPSGFWHSHAKPRYIDARVWLGDDVSWPDPDDAVATTVERYLGAFGPASTADIGRWLGQPRVRVLSRAIERLGDRLVSLETDDGRELLDLAGTGVPSASVTSTPRFLARWDAALIGYDARERILPVAGREAVVKKNGDFLPTFLVDGFVAGLWSSSVTKGTAALRLAPFQRLGRADARALEAEGERLIRFIEPAATAHEIAWEDRAAG